MKRTWFQAQIKQDIAISTQIEHERHSTHKRGSYSIFTKRSHSQAYISQIYQEHSYTSHEHHKQSHNLISRISWWAKHMRVAHLYDICYKCSLWYKDANMIWYINKMQHAYVQHHSQPKLIKEKQLKLSWQTSKCSLVQRLGKDIGKLLFCRYMDEVYVSFLNIVS
jgi:hypothetical protein